MMSFSALQAIRISHLYQYFCSLVGFGVFRDPTAQVYGLGGAVTAEQGGGTSYTAGNSEFPQPSSKLCSDYHSHAGLLNRKNHQQVWDLLQSVENWE